jgi:hypothetical protein
LIQKLQRRKAPKRKKPKSPNKLKIKKTTHNENNNPFIGIKGKSKNKLSSEKKFESAEKDDLEMNLEHTPPAQFVPDYLISEISNDNDANMFANNNFLFGQLDCTDNLDEELSIEKERDCKMSSEEYGNFLSGPYDGYIDFNADLQKFTEEMDEQNKQIEDQNEEAQAAGRMLNYLISWEGVYSPDPDYFERWQPDITNMMRAILLDWMMEVWNEFTLKRETFHYSLNYVDRFLSAHANIKKEELQLIGVTALFLAAKMEEVYSPRVADFAKSTDNGYNVEQIVKMEKLMLKELSWRTTPPTYAMWANWYMNQWDIYISTNEYAMNHKALENSPSLTFKTSDEAAYSRYREVLQIIDLIIFDHNWLLYKPRGLVASVMFLILGIHVEEYTIQRIWSEFIFSSSGFLDPNSAYNLLYMDFLFLSFGFQLHDLAPTIQYVASFMSIPFNYDLPMYAQNKNALDGHFEEFLSYQTHHPLGLEFMKRRIMNEENSSRGYD